MTLKCQCGAEIVVTGLYAGSPDSADAKRLAERRYECHGCGAAVPAPDPDDGVRVTHPGGKPQ